MRVLLDTNIILDYLLDRPPFADDAAEVWQANEQGKFEAFVSAITPVNVFYVARKIRGIEMARQIVAGLLTACRVAAVDEFALRTALAFPMNDYEDAVQVASATASQLDAIVTRDTKDYTNSPIPTLSATDFLKQLRKS